MGYHVAAFWVLLNNNKKLHKIDGAFRTSNRIAVKSFIMFLFRVSHCFYFSRFFLNIIKELQGYSYCIAFYFRWVTMVCFAVNHNHAITAAFDFPETLFCSVLEFKQCSLETAPRDVIKTASL